MEPNVPLSPPKRSEPSFTSFHLNTFRVWRLRNLLDVSLDGLKPFNIISGANGSGKTSLLEALYLLGTGRSFRTAIIRQYIQHKQPDAMVFAESNQHRFGLQKLVDGSQTIKVDGQVLDNLSLLAKQFPVTIIDPESLMLLDDGGKSRRQLLDWLMFHVEPSFYTTWLNYQKVLKHRNALLKQFSESSSGNNSGHVLQDHRFVGWEIQLAQLGESIHALRENVVADWIQAFNQVCSVLLPEHCLQLFYYAGFDTQTPLHETLKQNRVSDIARGFTYTGAHRADIRVKTATGQQAEQVLSRGQKKLLLVALKVSQLCCLHEKGKWAVVLLDDVAAELDAEAQARLLKLFAGLNSQVFLTALDATPIVKMLQTHGITPAMFHVEHGKVI